MTSFIGFFVDCILRQSTIYLQGKLNFMYGTRIYLKSLSRSGYRGGMGMVARLCTKPTHLPNLESAGHKSVLSPTYLLPTASGFCFVTERAPRGWPESVCKDGAPGSRTVDSPISRTLCRATEQLECSRRKWRGIRLASAAQGNITVMEKFVNHHHGADELPFKDS